MIPFFIIADMKVNILQKQITNLHLFQQKWMSPIRECRLDELHVPVSIQVNS